MKEIDHRLRQLADWRGMGRISHQQGLVASAERWEADQSALVVRVEPPEEYGCYAGIPVVLVKVTAKRIYTRYMGTSRETIWNLDGTSPSHWIRQRIRPDDVQEIHRRQVQQ